MPSADVVEVLRTRFGGEPYAEGIVLPPETLREALRALRDRHGYRYYVCAIAIDRGTTIEIVHGLRDPATGDTIFIKAAIPKDRPEIESAALVYAGAEWHEREILDLFGVVFSGHPDPRRILMPDEYEGHPLLKDFPIDTPWGYRPATAPEAGS